MFREAGTERLASAQIVEHLAKIEGRPWPEWGKHRKPISPNQLASQLRKFGVVPGSVRVGNETPKGYYLADFKEPFERFLPGIPVPDRNTATTRASIDGRADSEPQPPRPMLHPDNAVPTNKDRLCGVVAVQIPSVGEKEHSPPELVL